MQPFFLQFLCLCFDKGTLILQCTVYNVKLMWKTMWIKYKAKHLCCFTLHSTIWLLVITQYYWIRHEGLDYFSLKLCSLFYCSMAYLTSIDNIMAPVVWSTSITPFTNGVWRTDALACVSITVVAHMTALTGYGEGQNARKCLRLYFRGCMRTRTWGILNMQTGYFSEMTPDPLQGESKAAVERNLVHALLFQIILVFNK